MTDTAFSNDPGSYFTFVSQSRQHKHSISVSSLRELCAHCFPGTNKLRVGPHFNPHNTAPSGASPGNGSEAGAPCTESCLSCHSVNSSRLGSPGKGEEWRLPCQGDAPNGRQRLVCSQHLPTAKLPGHPFLCFLLHIQSRSPTSYLENRSGVLSIPSMSTLPITLITISRLDYYKSSQTSPFSELRANVTCLGKLLRPPALQPVTNNLTRAQYILMFLLFLVSYQRVSSMRGGISCVVSPLDPSASSAGPETGRTLQYCMYG